MFQIKRLVAIILMFTFITTLSLDVSANENIEIGNNYEGKEIVAVLHLEGITYYLNQAELNNLKNGLYDEYIERKMLNSAIESVNIIKDTNASIRNTGSWSSITVKSRGSSYLNYSKTERVTPYSAGPCSISYGESKSFSYSCNLSLTATERLDIGGTWSASSNKSFGTTYNVASGKIGYVKFTPMYRNITATRYNYFDGTLLNTENLTIKQPVKIGAFADGLYELAYK